MSFIKSQFEFSKKDQIGILFLCLAITSAFIFFAYYKPQQVSQLDVSSDEVLAIQAQIDSLKQQKATSNPLKRYPFNPNFITEYKAYTLGLTNAEFERLQAYRNQDKWINSISDFKSVTKVSDSLLSTFKNDFKFPQWVTHSNKPKKVATTIAPLQSLSFEEKTDLNTATAGQLQVVSGIGPALSERIITYRNKLGGFIADAQLTQVWGLDSAVVKRTLAQFTVKTPKKIKRYDINTATASDIATVPGVSFDLAKEIWEFRTLRERLTSIDELSKIPTISPAKLSVIKLYLYAE